MEQVFENVTLTLLTFNIKFGHNNIGKHTTFLNLFQCYHFKTHLAVSTLIIQKLFSWSKLHFITFYQNQFYISHLLNFLLFRNCFVLRNVNVKVLTTFVIYCFRVFTFLWKLVIQFFLHNFANNDENHWFRLSPASIRPAVQVHERGEGLAAALVRRRSWDRSVVLLLVRWTWRHYTAWPASERRGR